jgi:hypothetical protein
MDGNECNWICYVTAVRGRETGAVAGVCGKNVSSGKVAALLGKVETP